MEHLQEKKIEFLKFENAYLKSMIKNYIICSPNLEYSKIISENKHEIDYLKADNEELLSIFHSCSIMLKPRSYKRN
jgi:hypothetical protein